MKKFQCNIDPDIYHDITLEENKPSLYLAVFLAKEDEPSLEGKLSFEKSIDNFIDANIIPNGTVKEEDREFMLGVLSKFKELLEEKVELVRTIPHYSQK